MCISWCLEDRRWLEGVGALFTMWIPEMELRSLGFVVSAFTPEPSGQPHPQHLTF